MKVLVFDTETTGLPVQGEDPLSIVQPWPVQLGVVMLGDNFEIIKTVNTLVKVPRGAPFHEKAVEVHGITPALCQAEGRPIKEVLAEFRELCEEADLITAYNLAFDEKVMRQTSMRIDPEDYSQRPIFPDNTQTMCIMKRAEVMLNRPVRLSGAYYTFLRKKIEDAHDAFADTLAAAEVLKAMLLRAAQTS